MRLQVILTSWRFLYTTVLIVFSILVGSNEIYNKDHWLDTLGEVLAGDNWVHIASAFALGSGVITALVVLWALAFDRGNWQTACTPQARLRRILFELSTKLAAMFIISIASIYFYVHKDSQIDIRGLSYTVILGGIFLALVVLDQLLFTPSLAYIELMASPCMYPATRNCRMNIVTGETVPHRSIYSAHLARMLGVLPFLGGLGDEKLEVGGVPIALLVSGGYNSDQQQHFQTAAKLMIEKMQDMYGV